MPRTTLPMILAILLAAAPAAALAQEVASVTPPERIEVGPRPHFLVEDMATDSLRERTLKARLQQCADGPFRASDFSIGHRGAALQFPEHTRESYLAAARMGAGILECDVTFTEDEALVCRHSQCDLHYTTNILETDLARQCSVPPAFDEDTGELVNGDEIRCCTSDITLAEFRRLEGRMEGYNPEARSIEAYLDATPDWRTDLYASRGTLMTHAESIALFQALGVKMTPELKAPSVDMPFSGFSQEDYASKLIAEYEAAGVPPEQVFPQSFSLADVRYWIKEHPDFGEQAVFLDGRYGDEGFDVTDPASWDPGMEALAEAGVNILAPPLWMLLTADPDNPASPVVPSVYAERARAAGLDLITWTLERSPPLTEDGAWYHQTVDGVVDRDGDRFLVLDVLAHDVGVRGVFSDWPATVTYYASCLNLP